MKKQQRPLLWIAILAAPVFLFGAMLLFAYFRTIYYHSDQARRDDVAALFAGEYECLLLSMYPTEPFDAEPFAYFRGISTLKANHRFETINDISSYLEAALDAKQPLSTVYIGFDAAAVGSQYYFHASLYYKECQRRLLPLIASNPQISFELLLPYDSFNGWVSMSEKLQAESINACRNFVNIFSQYENVSLFFLGYEEWLICNPANYTAPDSCSPDITTFLLALTFGGDHYRLTPDNMEERFAALQDLIASRCGQTDPLPSLDLSGYDVVFFGDSVIGNYTGSLSIPGVVQGLGNAHAFNVAQGGTSATMDKDPSDASLNTVLDAFLAKDAAALDPEKQAYMGLGDYLEHLAPGSPCENAKLCFVLGYGLNDYFSGQRIASENPLDIYTYKGSIRCAVAKLQKAYPDSIILLMTPNFCSYFRNGTDFMSDVGGQLADYADAVLELSKELGVRCLDNYRDLGINAQNHVQYLADGCHPNERGRYLIGRRILQALQN